MNNQHRFSDEYLLKLKARQEKMRVYKNLKAHEHYRIRYIQATKNLLVNFYIQEFNKGNKESNVFQFLFYGRRANAFLKFKKPGRFIIPVHSERTFLEDAKHKIGFSIFVGLFSLMERIFIPLLGDNIKKTKVAEFVVNYRGLGYMLILTLLESETDWTDDYEYVIKKFNRGVISFFIGSVLTHYSNRDVYEMVKSVRRKLRFDNFYIFKDEDIFSEDLWLKMWDNFFSEVILNIVQDSIMSGSQDFLREPFSSDFDGWQSIFEEMKEEEKSDSGDSLFCITNNCSSRMIKEFILDYLANNKSEVKGIQVCRMLVEVPRVPNEREKVVDGYNILLATLVKKLMDGNLIRKELRDNHLKLIMLINLVFDLDLKGPIVHLKAKRLEEILYHDDKRYTDCFYDLDKAIENFLEGSID
ncbi:hypothetical protein [Arachidicoccus terrestris]|uniref:hypothetical protein n=1 Tax=Arachidicoccus terrestris TaxID=2875539 RepID=UPI001CC49EE7|nr:hypothetical protein [Arachidicoccus terrestris]UAY56662.1 hypothetical protein K9M52_06590 [Arachidicoccus terrestris]